MRSLCFSHLDFLSRGFYLHTLLNQDDQELNLEAAERKDSFAR